MNHNRIMVAQAVLDGVIGAEYLTDQELQQIEQFVQELFMHQHMQQAVTRGCMVFDGVAGDTIQ